MLAPTLILGGTVRVVVAIARSLNRAGIPIDVASLRDAHPPRVFSRAIRNQFALPDYRESPDAFINALTRVISQHHFDMVIPSTDSALIALAPHYEELRRLLYVACPPPHIIQKVLDKRITLEAGQECGLQTPRVFDIGNHDVDHTTRLPVIAKPANKFRHQEAAVRHFYDFGDLRKVFTEEPEFQATYLLQEFCEGEGVGVTVLLWDGVPRAVFQHRRLKELPSQGGVSTLAEAQAPDPVLVEQSVTLLRRLGWQGTAMVEFRYNRDTGTAILMEVNGRYWGSLPLAVRAGMDFPLYEWQLAHGREPSVPVRYAEGMKMLWRAGDAGRLLGLFRCYLKHGLDFGSLMRESTRFGRDFLSRTPDAVWSLRDPLPAFAELFARIKRTGPPASTRPDWMGNDEASRRSIMRMRS